MSCFWTIKLLTLFQQKKNTSLFHAIPAKTSDVSVTSNKFVKLAILRKLGPCFNTNNNNNKKKNPISYVVTWVTDTSDSVSFANLKH